MLYLMNSPILTGYGLWRFTGPLEIEAAKTLLAGEYTSAIGHETTAQYLSLLLGKAIPTNRITARLEQGDRALVLRIKERLPEGIVLDHATLASIPSELSILTRLE